VRESAQELRLTVRRDGPVGRLDLSGYRVLREAEPWTSGLGVGNSINALVTTHDDADYFLTSGGSLHWTWHRGLLRGIRVRAGYEHHGSVDVGSGTLIGDLWGSGTFQPNPPVDETLFGRGALDWAGWAGPVRLALGTEVLTDWSRVAGRAWLDANVAFRVAGRSGRLAARVGATRGDPLPQLAWRLGGPQTVRGYLYGERIGRHVWAAQLDLALTRSSFVAPVLFVDVGDTFSGDPLVGVGGGLSILEGLIRFNLSAGVRPERDVRFDLMFRAPR
jgi:hypothetical protein